MSPLQDELEKIRAETPDEDEEAAESEEAETTPETPDDDDAQTAPPALPDVDPNAIEKEAKRHERALAKIMGAAWEGAQPCEECGALGFLPPGHEPPPKLSPHPTLVQCRECNGFGYLATPSKHPDHLTEPCTKCNGYGAVDRAVYEREVTPPAPQPFAGAPMPPPMPKWDEARGVWTDQYGNALGSPNMYTQQQPNGLAIT